VVIACVHEVGGFSLLLDIKVWDKDEANKAIMAGVDIIMLDNIEGSELTSVTRHLRKCWVGKGKRFLLETSRGITEGNLHKHAIPSKQSPNTEMMRIHDHFYACRDRYIEHERHAPVVMSPTTKTQVSHLMTHFLIYLLLV